MSETIFKGQATIKVRFRNKAEYDKFRIYVLKTKWNMDVHPCYQDIVIEFENSSDIDRINRQVIQLLQLGFEVYTCRFKLEQQLAEEEYPPEDIPETDPDEREVY